MHVTHWTASLPSTNTIMGCQFIKQCIWACLYGLPVYQPMYMPCIDAWFRMDFQFTMPCIDAWFSLDCLLIKPCINAQVVNAWVSLDCQFIKQYINAWVSFRLPVYQAIYQCMSLFWTACLSSNILMHESLWTASLSSNILMHESLLTASLSSHILMHGFLWTAVSNISLDCQFIKPCIYASVSMDCQFIEQCTNKFLLTASLSSKIAMQESLQNDSLSNNATVH